MCLVHMFGLFMQKFLPFSDLGLYRCELVLLPFLKLELRGVCLSVH